MDRFSLLAISATVNSSAKSVNPVSNCPPFKKKLLDRIEPEMLSYFKSRLS